jgi:uncharacterized protein
MAWYNKSPHWQVQEDTMTVTTGAKVVRRGTAVEVQYSLDGKDDRMLRLAYFTPVETINVGVMCAAPEGNGFSAMFEEFQISSL